MTTLAIVMTVAALALAVWCALLLRSAAALKRELQSQSDRALEAERARDLAQARLDDHRANQERARETFQSLAGDALKNNSEQFFKYAKQVFDTEQQKAKGELEQRKQAVDSLVKPINEKLKETSETLQKLEAERIKAHAALQQQTQSVEKASVELREQTARLVQALRKPEVRGRYGEIQLKRVVELAGMRDYCDYDDQASTRASDGSLLRPDMVVSLPNNRRIAIDAKANLQPYLEAIEAETPEEADGHLDRFARAVLDQARALAKKDYGGALEGAYEFVVMFIPGDQFIDAALQRKPELLDIAAQERVIIASPSTLIGLLRAVHVGWREKSLSDSAQELFTLGRELHDRAVTALDHARKVGAALDAARDRYNNFVGSVDGRLMPTLRKFEESGAKSSKELQDLQRLEGETREIQSLPAPPPPRPDV